MLMKYLFSVSNSYEPINEHTKDLKANHTLGVQFPQDSRQRENQRKQAVILTTAKGVHGSIKEMEEYWESPSHWHSSTNCSLQTFGPLHLTGKSGGVNVNIVLLSCVHLLPFHFAKDHTL